MRRSKKWRSDSGHRRHAVPFKPPLSVAWFAVDPLIALPYVRPVRSRARARANAVHNPENLDVTADRSVLPRAAGSFRRGGNNRGCYHSIHCARHKPSSRQPAYAAVCTLPVSPRCASKIHVTRVTEFFRVFDWSAPGDRANFCTSLFYSLIFEMLFEIVS